MNNRLNNRKAKKCFLGSRQIFRSSQNVLKFYRSSFTSLSLSLYIYIYIYIYVYIKYTRIKMCIYKDIYIHLYIEI